MQRRSRTEFEHIKTNSNPEIHSARLTFPRFHPAGAFVLAVASRVASFEIKNPIQLMNRVLSRGIPTGIRTAYSRTTEKLRYARLELLVIELELEGKCTQMQREQVNNGLAGKFVANLSKGG